MRAHEGDDWALVSDDAECEPRLAPLFLSAERVADGNVVALQDRRGCDDRVRGASSRELFVGWLGGVKLAPFIDSERI